MGASIDLAVSKFDIIDKFFYKANVLLDFDLLESDNSRLYLSMFRDYDNFEAYSGDSGDIVPYFEFELEENIYNFYNEYYKKDSLYFINYLLDLKDVKWLSSDLYKNLIDFINLYGKENLYICVDISHFYIICDWEKIIKKVYVGSEFLPCNEDGKLLLRALGNLELYDFKLENVLIYYENYLNTEVNSDSNYDNLIHFDSRTYVSSFESFLSNVVKHDDDEFFEQRYERWLIILEHLKNGVKYIYSV